MVLMQLIRILVETLGEVVKMLRVKVIMSIDEPARTKELSNMPLHLLKGWRGWQGKHKHKVYLHNGCVLFLQDKWLPCCRGGRKDIVNFLFWMKGRSRIGIWRAWQHCNSTPCLLYIGHGRLQRNCRRYIKPIVSS
jgi:hypothetical protein